MQSKTRMSGLLGMIAIIGTGLLAASCVQQSNVSTGSAPIETISTVPSRVAITIDDLPYVPRSKTSPQEGLGYVESIKIALAKHDIVATGFAVGQQIDAATIPAIQAFADGGHTIGNHSWSHPDYGKLTAEEFRDETTRAHQILSKWIDGPRYYRFPFLKQGETEQAEATATKVLSSLGYVNVPVTIDNDEWLFNAD